MSRLPIALHADHPLLLDEALRRFPGRLLVDSLCEIERPLLKISRRGTARWFLKSKAGGVLENPVDSSRFL